MKKLLAGAAMALVLVGCSHSATDYRDAAKKAIASKDAETQLAHTFSDIECDTPASKDVGTTFTCTATADDGVAWTFTANIESKNKVLIVDAQPEA